MRRYECFAHGITQRRFEAPYELLPSPIIATQHRGEKTRIFGTHTIPHAARDSVGNTDDRR